MAPALLLRLPTSYNRVNPTTARNRPSLLSVWAMENLLNGQVVNRISVDPDDAKWARVALERMRQIT